MSLPGAVSAAPSPHNDWTLIAPVEPGHPAPTAQVSVLVVGDGGDPAGAARTVAALRQQRYPDRLLQIVTVAADSAFADEVGTAKGEIIVRIPAGAVPAPDLVSALTRWQQASPAAVSVAVPMIFSGRAPDPDVIVAHASAGTLGQLFPGSTVDPGLARLLDTTHQLRTADHLVFLAAAGTGYAFQRDRYQAGSDQFQGADVEVAYRLAQAGAVFVPEPAATLWTAAAADPVAAGRADAELTDLVPFPRERRRRPGRVWQVPLVTAVVPVDQPYQVVRSCVDRLLGGNERDLHVVLVGDWAAAGTDSGGTDSGRADLRLLAAEYRSEPRVRMVSSAPVTAFPTPYLLRVPSRLGVGPRTVGSLVAAMEKWRCGLLRVLPAGAGAPTHAVELWSTAARSRAVHGGTADGALVEAVAASHGQRWETGSEYDVVDLTTTGSGAAGGQATAGPPAGRRAGQTVTVGGARSLGRATVFVARKYARGVRRRLVSR
ncbi:hypothetical protein O7543_22720 [Solwaraspora sp. WMMA2080]|uniref:hypothetical protein n=1 Tax=unclassified Solwaraspora TaxID=2627926 RepID=UPI00248C58B8|nr:MULTISPECIES: hypothetical protein [unclassified Solwaraspora]WBB96466.1 hypothetical protein O7553_24645 [Solwaraspora sp. WMMA2059]WBC19628.1 hypothetical protein O7543_22720 [Solwaraspora sp. WMMA2080]